MKACKICTNYQFCFVFVLHTCPPGRSRTLSIILYPSASTGVWKFRKLFVYLCRNVLNSVDKGATLEGGVARFETIVSLCDVN